MKIVVFEVNAIPESITNVRSVAVQKVGDDCEVIINTRDKWVGFEYKGGSYNPEARELTDANSNYISLILDRNGFPEAPFVDDGDPEKHHYTEVIILAENEDESKLIGGVRYVLQDKDQIIYLIQPLEVKSAITLAEYDEPNEKIARPAP